MTDEGVNKGFNIFTMITTGMQGLHTSIHCMLEFDSEMYHK